MLEELERPGARADQYELKNKSFNCFTQFKPFNRIARFKRFPKDRHSKSGKRSYAAKIYASKRIVEFSLPGRSGETFASRLATPSNASR